MTGSGKAASATRLTALAATAPPAILANRKKSLLDVIALLSCSMSSRASARRAGRHGQGGHSGAADQRCLQGCVRQPVLLLRSDGGGHGADLSTSIGHQLKDTNQHAVVTKLVFFGDHTAHGQHFIPVMLGHIK